ncbi:hypothetical protein [Rhizobium sp. Root1220]|uniref:hypothetical protein n=1 Tax=Rhizobium sp. Root1220 TaxID=1736432 RepID=UPI0012E3F043|nr:hypothetical protein [Rhizobium sp. Root1220]
MASTLEIFTTRKSGREVPREWPDNVKGQLVSESLRPGVMVGDVPERYRLKAMRGVSLSRSPALAQRWLLKTA